MGGDQGFLDFFDKFYQAVIENDILAKTVVKNLNRSQLQPNEIKQDFIKYIKLLLNDDFDIDEILALNDHWFTLRISDETREGILSKLLIDTLIQLNLTQGVKLELIKEIIVRLCRIQEQIGLQNT